MLSLSKNTFIHSSGSTDNSISHKDQGTAEVYFAKTKDIKTVFSRLKVFININDQLKSEKLHFVEDRDTYLCCHTLLRLILSRKLKIDPSGIRIINEGTNKPRLESDLLFFNISHTRDAFAIAISDHTEIGIDLEKVDRNIDFKSIAVKFFSIAERTFILDSPDDSRNRFFLLWTRKEALLKARGTGIVSDLSAIDVFRKSNFLKRKSCENMIDDSAFHDHYISSKRISNYYMSVAVPQKAKILLSKLKAESVQSYFAD